MSKSMFFILIAFITAISFAAEVCYLDNPESHLLPGQCYDVGYICNLSTEISGGVRFNIGQDSLCSNLDTTNFTTYPYTNDNTLDTTKAQHILRPILIEDPIENVDALAVVLNAAFLLNAFNERTRVLVTYHQLQTPHDINSIRFVGVFAYPE